MYLDAFGCHGIGGVWEELQLCIVRKGFQVQSGCRRHSDCFLEITVHSLHMIGIVVTVAVAIVGTLGLPWHCKIVYANFVYVFRHLYQSQDHSRHYTQQIQCATSCHPYPYIRQSSRSLPPHQRHGLSAGRLVYTRR